MIYEGIGAQVIPALINRALHCNGEPLVVWGSGEQYRDFVYVTDVVNGLWAARERGMGKGLIQLSTGVPTTVRVCAEMIVALARETLGLTKDHCQLIFNTTAMEGDRGRVGDNSKALAELGWEPQINFNEGLLRTFM